MYLYFVDVEHRRRLVASLRASVEQPVEQPVQEAEEQPRCVTVSSRPSKPLHKEPVVEDLDDGSAS